MAERELLAAKREIIEKDEKIVHLKEKVSILSRSSHEGEDGSVVRELKQRCLEYQKQIADMEVRERGLFVMCMDGCMRYSLRLCRWHLKELVRLHSCFLCAINIFMELSLSLLDCVIACTTGVSQ